jgi:hypothetical protein
LVLVVVSSQAIAYQRQAAENLGKASGDRALARSNSLHAVPDTQTAAEQSSATHLTNQKLTEIPAGLDCLEKLPAKMTLQFPEAPALNTRAALSLIVLPEASVQNTEIRILLPEGISLSSGSLQWNGNLSKNVMVQMDVFIRVEKVGVWRIEAVANSKPLVGYPKIRSTHCYVQVSLKEAFVLDAAPENLAKVDASRLDSGGSLENYVERVSGMVTFYGYWYYENVSKPARLARVELWNDSTPGDVLLATTFVQSDGYYEFPAISNTGSLDVYVKLFCQSRQHEIVRVVNGDDVIYWSQTDVHYNVTEGSVDMGSWVVEGGQKRCWLVYDDIVDGYLWLMNKTDYEMGHEVYARIVFDPSGSYCTGDGMVIQPLDAFDRDTVLHEYGHCIHYEVRGGSFPPKGDFSLHYPDTEADGGWALTEGWAEFFECAVDNNPRINYGSVSYGSLETTTYADGPFGHGDYGDCDGDIVEGAVAQVFWDIFDGVNPGDYPRWDKIAYGDYILNRLDKLWDILLNDDPDSVNSVWALWEPKDVSIWAIFRHARIDISRNIAVTNINPFQQSTISGETTSINVTLTNPGNTIENFSLAVSANDIQIALLENVTLENHSSETLSLNWNTTGFMKGDYTLSARAMISPEDLNVTDDFLEGNVITVLSPGHDICISSIVPSIAYNGIECSPSMQVRVRNWGSCHETFNVTIYASATFIGSQTVALEGSNYTILIFPWNTSGLEIGNYTISAYATPVTGEIDTADNTFDHCVLVTIPGDVDGDFENGHYDVDLFDAVRLLACYGTKESEPSFDPNCDIDNSGQVFLFDAVILLSHYGEKYP